MIFTFIPLIQKKILHLIHAVRRDLCWFFYSRHTNPFIKSHSCIVGGNKLSVNSLVRFIIHSSARMALGVGITINSGPIKNPVSAISFSVIAAKRMARDLLSVQVLLWMLQYRRM